MAFVSGVHVLVWMILWGALMRTIEIKFHDSDSPMGSLARALAVVY